MAPLEGEKFTPRNGQNQICGKVGKGATEPKKKSSAQITSIFRQSFWFLGLNRDEIQQGGFTPLNKEREKHNNRHFGASTKKHKKKGPITKGKNEPRGGPL